MTFVQTTLLLAAIDLDIPAMGIGSWILMGLLAGALARYLIGGAVGCFMTVLVGVVGAVLGGFLATALGFGGLSGFDIRSFLIATLGALLLLLILNLTRSR